MMVRQNDKERKGGMAEGDQEGLDWAGLGWSEWELLGRRGSEAGSPSVVTRGLGRGCGKRKGERPNGVAAEQWLPVPVVRRVRYGL